MEMYLLQIYAYSDVTREHTLIATQRCSSLAEAIALEDIFNSNPAFSTLVDGLGQMELICLK